MIDFAIIDVGSNSVRLMTLADGIVLYKVLSTTRLGEGLASSPYLKAEAIERTARAVEAFYNRAIEEGAKEVFAFTTAAVRTAANGEQFVERVKELCGLDVEIVSGEREARLGLSGALGEKDGALIDVGGASTELVVRIGGKIVYEKSVNIGVVRLKDSCGREKDKLQKASREAIEAFGDFPKGVPVYAIGGTATTIAAVLADLREYSAARVTGFTVTQKAMQEIAERLLKMSVEEIERHPCVTKRRGDVLGGGAVLFAEWMERFDIEEIIVTDGDNLEGYAKEKGLL